MMMMVVVVVVVMVMGNCLGEVRHISLRSATGTLHV